jgi:putative flavoprotein involved in K+ transport
MAAWVIIGAGPAGLAAAGALSHRGIAVKVVERGRVAESWRRRYDRVRLNTSSWMSYLPGGSRRLVAYGRFPSREDLIDYYERYARETGFDVVENTEVTRIDRGSGGWVLQVAGGEAVTAPGVIVATGKDHTPVVPDWPGAGHFRGELLHAAEYRNPQAIRGRDVLVVGAGNSGSEIALDLVEGGARSVRLSVRTPPNISARTVAGVPTDVFTPVLRRLPVPVVDRAAWLVQRRRFGDLSPYGLPRAPEGPYARLRRRGTIPTIDGGEFVGAIRSGAIRVVAGVERLEPGAVVLAGGERVVVDTLIAATGYAAALEPLVGHLRVLDRRGRPTHHGPAEHPAAPRLHFIGFTDPLSGNIRETRLVARELARTISRRPLEARAVR